MQGGMAWEWSSMILQSSFPLPIQKTLRGSKVGLGTFGKKFKAPEITEEDRIKAAAEVKKNTVKVSMLDLWRQLQVGRKEAPCVLVYKMLM